MNSQHDEQVKSLSSIIKGNPYPGRGIFIGTSPCGNRAIVVYFIMGRSDNSRNRIFEIKDADLYTAPFDPDLVRDPSLIIYRAMSYNGKRLIVSNGNQTDSILQGEKKGLDFDHSLMMRAFEPDGPHFTPRISAIMNFNKGEFDYEMSILKASDRLGSHCYRQFFHYPMEKGLGHFISTYVTDGNPLPSFAGEPIKAKLFDPEEAHEHEDNKCGGHGIPALAENIWQSLDKDNRVSMLLRAIDLRDGAYTDFVFNRNENKE